MLTTLFSQAGIGWLLRRIPDWGGWIGGIVGGFLLWFSELDPETQSIIIIAIQGNWQAITLGSLGGIVAWALSQWRSWRATVKPHVVTQDRRVLTEQQARDAVGGYTGPIERR